MGLFDKLQDSRGEKLRKEKEAGAAFMAGNKANEGIKELPNGIQ